MSVKLQVKQEESGMMKMEVEENKQQEIITIISCGKPGVGKSTVGNQILTGNHKSSLFAQGKNCRGYGFTRKIQGEKRKITLIDKSKRIIQYLDIPGVGDPTVDVQSFVDEIKNKYQSAKINIALLLITSQDNRKTIQEAFSCAFYKSFFKQNGLSSKQILYLVITRWQEYKMDEDDIQIKLQSLADEGLEIDPSRVIKYNLGSIKDLNPLYLQICRMDPSQGYNFKPNLNKGLCEFQHQMDEIVGRNTDLKHEMQALTAQVDKLALENRELRETIQRNQIAFEQALEKERQNTAVLTNIINSMPCGRKFCTLI